MKNGSFIRCGSLIRGSLIRCLLVLQWRKFGNWYWEMKNGSLIRCVRLSEVRLSNIDCIVSFELFNSNTVESTYMSSAYKSFSVISRVTLWTEFVPSLYVLKKSPYKSPLLPQNSVYKSRLGFILSVFTVKKRSNWLQLALTAEGYTPRGVILQQWRT